MLRYVTMVFKVSRWYTTISQATIAEIGIFIRMCSYFLMRFFLPAGKIIGWRLPPTVGRKTMSEYRLKTPPAPSVAPGARSTVSRLNGFRGPCRQLTLYLGPSHFADSSLAFFKEVGSSSGVTPSLVYLHSHVWWADVYRKRITRARRKPLVPLGLESHMGAC